MSRSKSSNEVSERRRRCIGEAQDLRDPEVQKRVRKASREIREQVHKELEPMSHITPDILNMRLK